MKTFRTVVSTASSQPFRDGSRARRALGRLPLQLALGSCLSLLGLSAGCAGDDAKKVVSEGEGGESGEAGAPFGSSTDASPQAGAGGASDPGSAGKGNAGEGATQAEGGAGGALGTAMAGAPANGEAGAVSAAGAPATGEGGAPSFPVSSCGPGMWMAAEVGCQPCPAAANQVFEMTCADYENGKISLNLAGEPVLAFASLPDGVQGHEASPVDVSVTYVNPDGSHPRIARLSTNAWSVDLSQSPEQPDAVIIPPFSTADVCGDVFRSLEPVRFNRVGEGVGASYEMVCP